MNFRKGEIATTLTVLTLGLMLLGTLIGSRTAVVSRLNSLTPRAQTSCQFNTRITVYQDVRDDEHIITFDDTFGDSWKVINDKQIETKLKKSSGDKADLNLQFATINPLYTPGDLASVRLRGPNDDTWDIVGVFCDNKSTTTNGCPFDIDTQNQSPQRLIQNFKVDCGVDIHYGWVLHNLKTNSKVPGGSTPGAGGGTTPPVDGATVTPASAPKPVTCSCKSNPGGERYCSNGCQSRRADGWCTTNADCVPETEITVTPTPEKGVTPPKKTITPPKTTPTAPPVTPIQTKGPKGDPTLCSERITAKDQLNGRDIDFTGPIRVTFIPSGFKQGDDANFRFWIDQMLTELNATNLRNIHTDFSFVYNRNYGRTNITSTDVTQSMADCKAQIGIVLVNNRTDKQEMSNFIVPSDPFGVWPYYKLSIEMLRVGPHVFPRAFGTTLGLWEEFLPSTKLIRREQHTSDDVIDLYQNTVKAVLDKKLLGYPNKLSGSVNCYSANEVARDSDQSKFKQNCVLPNLFAINSNSVMSERKYAANDSCVVGLYTDKGAVFAIPRCKQEGGLNFTSQQLGYASRMIAYYKSQVPAAPKPNPKAPKPTFNEFDINQDGKVNTLDVVRCLQGAKDCSVPRILLNFN